MIVLIVDNTSIQNWAYMNLPNLHALAARGALGLMNSNTAGQNVRPNALLTMGASAHLEAVGPGLGLPVGSMYGGVTVKSLVRAETGLTPPAGAIADLNWGQDAIANASQPYAFAMGALGQSVNAAGGRIEVFGNADIPSGLGQAVTGMAGPAVSPPYLDRSAVDFAANAYGWVQGGDVGDNLLIPTPGAPYGVSLDNPKLLADVLQAYPSTALLVVDYGDTVRADAWRHVTANARAANDATTFALHHFDSFLGALLPHVDLHNTLLVVFSSAPSSIARAGNETLTPVLVAGPGFTPGTLSSPTTHRLGIVSNIDVAPTIMHFLGIPTPADFFGAPMFTARTAKPLASLAAMGTQLAFQSTQRLPILKTLVYFIVLVFLLAIVYLLASRKRLRFVQGGLSALTMAVLYLPLGILVAPLGHPTDLGASFALIIGFTAVATFLTLRLAGHPLDRIMIPSVLTSLVLLADLFTGTHLIQNSALGYDPQIGARYYGIGNEYMGVLVGASAIGFSALLERWKKFSWLLPTVIVIFAVIVGAMVAPDLGTKAGGAITATAALGVVVLKLTGRKISWREVLGIAGVILALLVLLVVADVVLHSGASRTDIGRTGLFVLTSGPGAAIQIIVRKLSTNISLVQGSYWTLLLVVAIALVVAFLTVLVGSYRDIGTDYPRLGFGLFGALVGAGVGFVFNDTGVVAACTCIIFPIATALLLDLKKAPLAGRFGPRQPRTGA